MAQEVGFIEVFPPRAFGSRPPVLLQTLETQLLEAANAANRAATAVPQKHHDSQLATNLTLDVHRQVFQTFIEGFGPYGPLLQQIKQVFDQAIGTGLQDALTNNDLRQKLLHAVHAQAAAVAAARAEVIGGQQARRQELYDAIAAAQARLTAAERRRTLAAKDLARAKQELDRVRGLAKDSKTTKQRLADAGAAEAAWAAKAGSAEVLGMTAGPLSTQEIEELESEMGVAADPGAPVKHPLEQALVLLEKHDAAAAAQLLQKRTGASNAGGLDVAVVRRSPMPLVQHSNFAAEASE